MRCWTRTISRLSRKQREQRERDNELITIIDPAARSGAGMSITVRRGDIPAGLWGF